MTRSLSLLAVAVLVAGAFLVAKGGWPPEAKALDAPLGVLRGGSAGDMVPCATTVTKVIPATSTATARSVMIVPEAGGTVYVGGPNVDTTGGFSVCSSGCDLTTYNPDASGFYCIASGSAVDIKLVWAQ